MATHGYPSIDKKDPIEYINSSKLFKYAQVAKKILGDFEDLFVWKVQMKSPSYCNNAWYVGLATHEDPFLMNFTITSGNLNVEFRFSQFLPEEIFDNLKWQTKNWRRMDVNSYRMEYIKHAIASYVYNIRPYVVENKIKVGGRSFVEDIIFQDMSKIYPDVLIERNKRLDVLRSDKGVPLEFDIYIPELNIAVEVQGPQHFKKIFGDNSRLIHNDIYKKEWCGKNKTNLLCINWDEYNIKILKLKKARRIEKLKDMVCHLIESKEFAKDWPDDFS